MLISISKHFGVPPVVVEIHPGGHNNFYNHIIKGAQKIILEFEKEFEIQPLILLENRTNQFIATGEKLPEFWEVAQNKGNDIIDRLRIVLDMQQLFTSLNRNSKVFLDHLDKIPEESIKGIHIHRLHRPPAIKDSIPWEQVFCRLSKIRYPLIINPEVHHHNQVPETIIFCENLFENFLYIKHVNKCKSFLTETLRLPLSPVDCGSAQK